MEIYSTRIYLLMHDLCITNSMGIFGIFGIEKDRRGRGRIAIVIRKRTS